MKKVTYRKLRYNNEVFEDYVVSSEGEIYDTSYSPMKKVAINYPCKKKNHSCYARASLRLDLASQIISNSRRKTILVHIAVCDTWNRNSMPVPHGVSFGVWKRTHESVKSAIRFIYQVNHIDHDQHNHHPKNLEYTTAKQNQNKYQEHRLSKIAKQ
jgi:hypothetical protein